MKSLSGYVLISPCRDEEAFLERSINSVLQQTVRPTKWIIVDDGSTDATPNILAKYEAQVEFLEVITIRDRGYRLVGGGVVDAFNAGLERVAGMDYGFLCKLDLDLILPPAYFERLLSKMDEEPRLGTCSGMPYYRVNGGPPILERHGNEISAGMTKFYRRECFEQIGGFVREVMWDGIDCHCCRMNGWIAESFNDQDLQFEHLRQMGSSQKSIINGRMRHGRGQYFMGTSPMYMLASCLYRVTERPYIVGSMAMLAGYLHAAVKRTERYGDESFRRFLRRFQRRCLTAGKERAVSELNAEGLNHWKGHRHYAGRHKAFQARSSNRGSISTGAT